MKFDKQSNLYIVIYITLLVLVVGAALAFTSVKLRDRQNENIAADKMRQILSSLHVAVPKDSVVSKVFNNQIISEFIVDSDGQPIEGDAFAIDVAEQSKLPAEERQLPVYEARTAQGDVKYVLPVYGAGLWGPIWGYVAVDADGSTIYGAYFSHQGETPGLGAEISKPRFSNQFENKQLIHDGRMIPVDVVKKGQRPAEGADYVDAVSGGTITSRGVAAMMANCLTPYKNFLLRLNDGEEK